MSETKIYSLSTYDNEADDWIEQVVVEGAFALRRHLRYWRQWYDDVSLLVLRENP